MVFVKINKNHVLWHCHYLAGQSPSSTLGRYGFNTRPVCVVFVADGVELGKIFLEHFFTVSNIPQSVITLHNGHRDKTVKA